MGVFHHTCLSRGGSDTEAVAKGSNKAYSASAPGTSTRDTSSRAGGGIIFGVAVDSSLGKVGPRRGHYKMSLEQHPSSGYATPCRWKEHLTDLLDMEFMGFIMAGLQETTRDLNERGLNWMKPYWSTCLGMHEEGTDSGFGRCTQQQ